MTTTGRVKGRGETGGEQQVPRAYGNGETGKGRGRRGGRSGNEKRKGGRKGRDQGRKEMGERERAESKRGKERWEEGRGSAKEEVWRGGKGRRYEKKNVDKKPSCSSRAKPARKATNHPRFPSLLPPTVVIGLPPLPLPLHSLPFSSPVSLSLPASPSFLCSISSSLSFSLPT